MLRNHILSGLDSFNASVRRNANALFSYHEKKIRFVASVRTSDAIPSFGDIPEVIFTGRANVGKSTLINQICSKNNLALVSPIPGQTQGLNFFAVGIKQHRPPEVILVDSPGYGERGRPQWGALFDHYVATRTALRCVYLLIDGGRGITQYDHQMIQFLSQLVLKHPFQVQPVLARLDQVQHVAQVELMRQCEMELNRITPHFLPLLPCAAGRGYHRWGTESLRQSVYAHIKGKGTQHPLTIRTSW